MNNLIVNIQKKISEKVILIISLFALAFAALDGIILFKGMSSLLLEIIPPIFLVVYLTKFHKNLKATSFVPVIFGVCALCQLLRILFNASFSEVILTISFIVLFLSTLIGMKNELIVTIVMLICVLCEIPSIFLDVISVVGDIVFYISLWLFWIKNKKPEVREYSFVRKMSSKNDSEQSLRTLKEKLELGTITEEEYREQRAEIISKL